MKDNDGKVELVKALNGRSVRVRGHWLFCVKCERRADYIVLPDVIANWANYVTVWGRGDQCGERRVFTDPSGSFSRKQLRRWQQHADAVPWLVNPVEVGDRLLMPDDHPLGIKWMGDQSARECFVDECVPMAIYDETVPGEHRPLGDRVLLKETGATEHDLDGDIVRPDVGEHHANRGLVVALGSGVRGYKSGDEIPFEFAVGEEVLFNRWEAHDIQVRGETFMLVRERFIDARVT